MISGYYFMAVACAMLLFLFYKEWTRKKRSFLYGRLMASLLAVVSLLFMAFPYADNNTATANKLVLLTDGFVKDSADDFFQKSNAGIPVYAASRIKYSAKHVRLVTDWNAFTTKHASDTFHVFGNGFSKEDLDLFNGHPIVFHAAPVLPAISHIYWKQKLEPGEQLLVQGACENTSGQKIKIVLQAFGAEKDTVFIAAGAHQDFELHTVPVHTGTAVYSLIVMEGKDTLQKEPVPVDVEATAPLQLLMISSSPDFDNTYLKNHLSRQGYQVTVVTSVSNNKTDKQFLNMPLPQANGGLTLPYLKKFDVLMADQEALQKASAAELAAIRSVVQDNGTGLIIKMDSGHAPAFYTRFFPLKKMKQEHEPFLLLRGSSPDSIRYKIKITDPVSIGYTPGSQMILQDAQSNMYAAGVLYGSGKIIATTLQNTYSIALAGNKALYQQLWWWLLNKAAKKIYPEETWRTDPAFSFVNNAVYLQVEKPELTLHRAVAKEADIFLKQDALLPFLWRGMYWPAGAGWQYLPRVNTAPGNWYVYKAGDWQQLASHQHAVATKNYAATHPVTMKEATDIAVRGFVNLPLCLLIIFMGACVFLWVEQKSG